MKNKITPCLWFDHEGEDAARFYIGIFPNSQITQIAHYCDEGQEVHGRPARSVMTVAFELNGQSFTALNGGPVFKISEAISFQIECEDQQEIDHYWSKLTDGGDPASQQCGWVKDRFGVSWQVVPRILPELLLSPETERACRVMQALLGMKKLEIAALQAAFEGEA